MKTIKDYIQFAIDNGFNFEYDKDFFQKLDYMPDGIIEGKRYIGEINISINRVHNFRIEFIQDKKMYATYYNLLEIITSKPFIEAIAKGILNKTEEGFSEEVYIEQITTEQAIAIRDNKLEEFINNLLTYNKNETNRDKTG